MRQQFWLIAVAWCLAACGFQPIYGTTGDYDIEVGTYLSSIEFSQRSGVLGQQLQNAMEDRFDPEASGSLYGKSFRLQFGLDSKRDAVVIGQDGSIARYNILLTSPYTLIDIESGAVLDRGTVRRTASFYNAPDKFSAYVAEKNAIDRALTELSEDYKLRMAAYFAQHYKLGPRD
jgi:hypothetical protein